TRGLDTGKSIAAGINLARELGNLPGNICTPTYLASEAKRLARGQAALSVKVLEEKQMKELGMGSLLSVSAGSDQPAKLIVMEYSGGGKKDAPIALVGKGITFDTGGIAQYQATLCIGVEDFDGLTRHRCHDIARFGGA